MCFFEIDAAQYVISVILPGGVIGNTAEFGSAFPGSSPGWAVSLRSKIYVFELRLVS